VITRLVQRVGEIIPRGISTLHKRSRAAKRGYQQIQRMTRVQRRTRLSGKYRELIEIPEDVVPSAHAVLQKTQEASLRDELQEAWLRKLQPEIRHDCPLGERVLDQTRRRVREGSKFPTRRKCFPSAKFTPIGSGAANPLPRRNLAIQCFSPRVPRV
jgi:transposase, IS5 family